LKVKDEEFWLLMEDKLNDDAWYTTFNEAVNALEGFTYLRKYND